MKNLKFIILLCLTSCLKIYSTEVYLETTKFKEKFYKIIISSSEIKNFFELNHMLKTFTDGYFRSPAQMDISLNGATFEQIKVLLNGVPVNDPQTGHHNFNLPLSIDDIEYIEIIKSDNFSKYGPYAVNGVVNIVTKKTAGNSLGISYGSFDSFNLTSNISSDNQYLSFNFSKSNSFRPNTDYNYYNIFYTATINDIELTSGFLDKKFGAQDFYSQPSTRKEYEQVKTTFFSVSKRSMFKNFLFNTNLFYRSGYDFYTTSRDTPTVYSNYHNSYVYGINCEMFKKYKFLEIQPIFEVLFKQLDSKGFSSNFPWHGMGEFFDYEIRTGGNFVFNYKKFSVEVSVLGNYYSKYQFIPQAGTKMNFKIVKDTNLYFIISNTHRVPSYTELYYWDPLHQAKESLKVEKTTMYQTGISIVSPVELLVSLFFYEPTDTIDWMRNKNSTRWVVSNIAKVKSCGSSFNLSFKYKNLTSKVIYTYLTKEFELPENKELKYIENYPKHSLSLMLYFSQIFNFDLTIYNNYKYMTKTNIKEANVCGFGLTKKFGRSEFKFFVENLFNIKYEDLPNIQGQPRSLYFTVKSYF